MLRPSYSELMEILNEDRDLDSKITSRYTIVIAAAKRARQIVNSASCYDNTPVYTDKAVSVAISELERGLIKLYPEGLTEEYNDAVNKNQAQLTNQNGNMDGQKIDFDDDFDDLSAMEDFDLDEDFGGEFEGYQEEEFYEEPEEKFAEDDDIF